MTIPERISFITYWLPEREKKEFINMMDSFEKCAGAYFELEEQCRLLQLENKKLREKIDYLEEQNETEM